MSKTHKATLLAWVRNDSVYQMDAVSSDDAVRALQAVSFYLTPDGPPELGEYWERGHVLVGRADITLILDDPNKITESQLTTLRAQKASVLAEAQNKATEIERQIQTLLAITNEVRA